MRNKISFQLTLYVRIFACNLPVLNEHCEALVTRQIAILVEMTENVFLIAAFN